MYSKDMKNRPFPYVTVTKKAEASLRKNHPWVYAEEITEKSRELTNGEITDVYSPKGAWLGCGFYSAFSKIGIRILSRNANDLYDEAFWSRRIRYALDYRKSVLDEKERQCCRLIFGESDGFPGFTLDRFGRVLVAQIQSFGTEQIKEYLYDEILRQLAQDGEEILGIYERNDSNNRLLEGLEKYEGWAKNHACTELNREEINENGILYQVDFKDGQKTGYFLDQKFNRLAIRPLAKDRTVLDLCCHTGSFALNAALAGARHVTAVDISQSALDSARENAKRNGLEDKIDFICADVFDILSSYKEKSPHPYDFIILDPPAFTKSRRTLANAEKGYLEINRLAMQLLPRGGYLATCSCSHFMNRERFEAMLLKASELSGVQLKQIEARQQAKDHPILWNVPETDYLKFYLFQLI